MIGSLAGVLTFKAPPHLLLEVGGVGYELEAPMSTFYELPAPGERVRLLTHLLVREDAQVLYGFATDAERTLFRHLLKVSGIGPRIALAILSGVTGPAFAQAIQEQDAATLTRIPGVGRKTAERLIVEMRDRLGQLGVAAAAPAGAPAQGAEAEAYGALVSLGYRPAEAARLLKSVSGDGGGGTDAGGSEGNGGSGLATEELIRRALRSAVRA
jgi:Holliday junction DNA helicase RuvA